MTANRIIAHVFLQPSLHLVNEAAIEQLVADHPYFSAARLLLARKVYQKTGDLQSSAVKKALLYTNQHHYAYQVISEEQLLQEVENRVASVIPEDTLPGETVESLSAESQGFEPREMMAAQPDTTGSIADEIAEEEALPVVEDRLRDVIPEDQLPGEATIATPPVIEEEVATIAAAAVHPTTENHFAVVSEDVPEVEAASAAEVTTDLPEAAPTADTEVTIPTELPGSTIMEKEMPLAIADFEPAGIEPTISPNMPAPPVIAAAAENSPTGADEEVEAAMGPIKIFPLSERVEETELIFQPLYTDDYFAYKRLKNPEEADDLNEQGAAEMKSFTSWLRQMKDNFVGKTSKDWYHQQLHRIYEEEDEPEVSETVEKMAMDSIVFNNDIVSETLAEIWVRQHQYTNAIKIYQKLSLLNPDKNAYFAQKILELKSLTDKK
ncbi:hypothetical protein [Chitinophaga sp. RAB17]|uniref:hypothetical protein n=1 Tax=Chitinophaga sp. RAB17 TaxID=3233049 RepID=UPI003F8FA9E6